MISVLLWWQVPAPLGRFTDIATTFANLGQIAAIIGMTLFAITLLLSSCWWALERYFDGLNEVYIRQ